MLSGLADVVKELDVLEVAALQWRACMEQALRDGERLPVDRYREYQLADLDQSKLEEIVAFRGLSKDANVIAEFNKLYSYKSIKRHSDELSANERELIMKWIEPTLEWMKNGGRAQISPVGPRL